MTPIIVAAPNGFFALAYVAREYEEYSINQFDVNLKLFLEERAEENEDIPYEQLKKVDYFFNLPQLVAEKFQAEAKSDSIQTQIGGHQNIDLDSIILGMIAHPDLTAQSLIYKAKELLSAQIPQLLDYHIAKSKDFLSESNHQKFWDYTLSLLKLLIQSQKYQSLLSEAKCNTLWTHAHVLIVGKVSSEPPTFIIEELKDQRSTSRNGIIDLEKKVDLNEFRRDLLKLTEINTKSGKHGFTPYLGKEELQSISMGWFGLDISEAIPKDHPESAVSIDENTLRAFIRVIYLKHFPKTKLIYFYRCSEVYWPLSPKPTKSVFVNNFTRFGIEELKYHPVLKV
jgi:hypothetical protein